MSNRLPGKFTGTSLSAGILLLSAAASPARADVPSMNYGSLELMFGEPVTASATGTPQRVSETPVNLTIITAEQIRQAGTRSIAAVLARVPGLDILQTGINAYDVGVRGYQQPFQPRLLVLVDGRQVFVDDYSRTFWDNIPVNIDDIRQIEIVKGAASALFGSNAAGGVINIVTYSPDNDKNRVASVGGGTQSSYFADGTATFNGSWGGTKLSAGYDRQNEFSTPRAEAPQPGEACCGDQLPPQKPFREFIAENSVFNLTPSVRGIVEVNYSTSGQNLGDPTDAFVIGGETEKTWSMRGGLTWQSPLGLISFDTYFNQSDASLFEPSDAGRPYSFYTKLLVSQLTDQFRVGESDIFRMSAEYRYKDFEFKGVQTADIGDQAPKLGENNMALAGTWVHQISPSVTSTIAARFDHLEMSEIGSLSPYFYYTKADYSHDDNAWSGNADIVWSIDGDSSLKGGYGRGVQMPSFMQSQYGQIVVWLGSPSVYPGNPDLKPTIVQDLSLTYSRKIAAIDSTVSLSPYAELNQDIVAPFVYSPQLPVYTIGGVPYTVSPSANLGNSKGYGGEVELQGSRAGFRWDLSYSLSRVFDWKNFNTSSGVVFDGSAPEHHLRAWLGYSIGNWEIDGNAQYLTSTDMPRSLTGGLSETLIPTAPYFTLGGRIAYTLPDGTTLSVNGTDLQAARIKASPYPELQRELYAEVSHKF